MGGVMITATPETPAPEQRLAAIDTLLTDPEAVLNQLVDKARPLSAKTSESQ
jgi:hypothetical protein